MTQDTVQALESNIQEARKIVDLYAAYERLLGNRDFKLVVREGYFKDEAVRLVHLKADPSMDRPDRQASIVAQIDAIGGLSSYFRTLAFNAMTAEKAIESDEFTRDELLAEELAQ